MQTINEEFYSGKLQASDQHYQLLLNYLTPFEPENWSIYKKGGFYLLLPFQDERGFNSDNLEKVDNPEDIPFHYFSSEKLVSLPDALYEFFLTGSEEEWDIALSGHGGGSYQEYNDNGVVTWVAEPIIADLPVDDFKAVLAFFNAEVNTHFFHYSCCFGGGNHIDLAYDKEYQFPIICDSLTDCYSYCKWNNQLPSDEKKYLTAADLYLKDDKWHLSTESVYRWRQFFTDIENTDFSPVSLERLPEILSSITNTFAADISLLRLAGSTSFYPIYPVDTFRVDERDVTLHGIKTVLVESEEMGTISLDGPARFLSIKPGDATHHIKKLQCAGFLHLPTAFWQAEGQSSDKTFLLDECIYTLHGKEITLRNVLIHQQQNHLIRIFFTLGDEAMMMVANKSNSYEIGEEAQVLEFVNSQTGQSKRITSITLYFFTKKSIC